MKLYAITRLPYPFYIHLSSWCFPVISTTMLNELFARLAGEVQRDFFNLFYNIVYGWLALPRSGINVSLCEWCDGCTLHFCWFCGCGLFHQIKMCWVL